MMTSEEKLIVKLRGYIGETGVDGFRRRIYWANKSWDIKIMSYF